MRSHLLLSSLVSIACSFAPISANALTEDKIPGVAVVTTVWYQNSHADLIAGRLLEGYTLDGRGEFPRLKLVSLYVDQFPESDKSRELAKKHDVPIFNSIAGALTLGGDRLAVDGILVIAEHGQYPTSPTGSTEFPKRRMFGEIVKVFEASGRVVPIFNDKHIEDDWADIEAIWREKERFQIPLMAGSSLPTLWRYPEADVELGRPLKEIVAVSYHTLDAYGFHALEMVQCLAERRNGGETGIRGVRCLTGDAVWQAGKAGVYDQKLLDEALTRLERPLKPGKSLPELVKEPDLFVIDYRDGLRASVLTLNGAVADWTVAWRYGDDGATVSTRFATQEVHPFQHFAFQLKGVEKMVHTGRPTWPPERTLFTSAALDALLVSKKNGGRPVETPHLNRNYLPTHPWRQPIFSVEPKNRESRRESSE